MADGVMPAKSSIIDQDLGCVCIALPSKLSLVRMTGLCRYRLAQPKAWFRHRCCAVMPPAFMPVFVPVLMPLTRAIHRPSAGGASSLCRCNWALGFVWGILRTEIAYSLKTLFLDSSQEASGLVPVRVAVFSVSKELPSCPALLIAHSFRVVNGWLRPSPCRACWH